MKKEFRNFEDARKFVHSLRLVNLVDWNTYRISGKKPDNIPSNPNIIYKKKWKSWGDFLGTGTVAAQNRQYRQFEDARSFVQSLNLKGQKEWFDFSKSSNKPDDIPVSLNRVYKKEWTNWGDFLGTGNIAPKDKKFRSFEESRKFVQALGLKGSKEWEKYCISGNKPDDIPTTPNATYKDEGWKGHGDWLGTGRVADQNKEYRSFEEAREFTRKLGLKGQKEWEDYCKSGNKPDDIPVTVWNVYEKEWLGLWDFLGDQEPRNYLSFEDAKKFVRALKIKSDPEWRVYCKSGKRPKNIPLSLEKTYKKEWKGLGNFLGTGTIAYKNKQYRSFDEARKFVQTLGLKGNKEWKKYCISGNKPDDIPSHPWLVYQEWNIVRRKNEKRV